MNKNAFFLIFGLVLTLAVVKIVLAARLATTGVKLAKIEAISIQLTQENRILNEEIVENSSLNKISSEAASLGFVKGTKIANFALQVPVALRE